MTLVAEDAVNVEKLSSLGPVQQEKARDGGHWSQEEAVYPASIASFPRQRWLTFPVRFTGVNGVMEEVRVRIMLRGTGYKKFATN